MTYNLRFAAIEIISKSIAERPSKEVGVNDYNFNFDVDIKLGIKQKIAVVLTHVSIVLIKEPIELANFKIASIFEFPEFDEVFKKREDDLYDIDIDLEIVLKSAGLTTIRGIIFSEVRGTYLNGAVLPIIDMANLVQDQRKEEKHPI